MHKALNTDSYNLLEFKYFVKFIIKCNLIKVIPRKDKNTRYLLNITIFLYDISLDICNNTTFYKTMISNLFDVLVKEILTWTQPVHFLFHEETNYQTFSWIPISVVTLFVILYHFDNFMKFYASKNVNQNFANKETRNVLKKIRCLAHITIAKKKPIMIDNTLKVAQIKVNIES